MTTATVRSLTALLAVGAVLAGIIWCVSRPRPDDNVIEGPYKSLLDASTDLGPANERYVQDQR